MLIRVMPFAVAAFAAVASPAHAAQKIGCYTDNATDGKLCVDVNNVRETNGVRSTPLYQGGPNAIRKTPYTFQVNCFTNIVKLKDADGVSFAGAMATDTKALRALSKGVCEAKPVK